ncbi:MAG: AIR synthase related protein [Candidatus Helarchaeota archaeon]|nr:AIR synthase related protein [Candidatus Helarchaeota archaeon]
MADLEGLTRTLLTKGLKEEEVIEKVAIEYLFYKNFSKKEAEKLARAILQEVENSNKALDDQLIQEVLEYPKAEITVGKQGVGCRGWGDFFVHKLIAELSKTKEIPVLSPQSLDDAGAIIYQGQKDKIFIVSKMEGMHSRLSDYPFLAGFHVTRAALRDLYVKGAKPISIMIDIHLADDADVGKLFDFMGGVAAVAELSQTPITAGSTLRIGGDMVIGTRITGGIAAIGLAKKLLTRRDIRPGDAILMTEGAGGGTIVTTAIYGAMHKVIKETLNIKFIQASERLFESNLLSEIHCMCDVTNGGLRGDLHEVAYEAKVGMTVYEEKIIPLVNREVFQMLKERKTDYLGVSLDALLIFCPASIKDRVLAEVRGKGIKIEVIGEVNANKSEIKLISERGETKLIPKFRESAYTPIKQEIGEEISEGDKQQWATQIEKCAAQALEKREKFVRWITEKAGD